MIDFVTAMLSEIVDGVLSFGLDRLGGLAGGGQLPFSVHPFGFRSRPRDPDTDGDGVPTKGAGLLLFDFGGGDEGALPTQDGRVELTDEGQGGAQMYGWTGSQVSSILISGDDGKVRVTSPEMIIGGDSAAKALATEALVTWISSTLIPALATAPGGPISVSPPSAVTTTKLRAE